MTESSENLISDYKARVQHWEYRRSVESGCRGYWRKRYGGEEEIASRGGVTWMCGAKPEPPRDALGRALA